MSKLVEDMAEKIYTKIYDGFTKNDDWKSWAELNDMAKTFWFRLARQLKEKFRLVQLDEDQSLPEEVKDEDCKCIGLCNVSCHSIERKLSQQDMLKAGFKKVKE